MQKNDLKAGCNRALRRNAAFMRQRVRVSPTFYTRQIICPGFAKSPYFWAGVPERSSLHPPTGREGAEHAFDFHQQHIQLPQPLRFLPGQPERVTKMAARLKQIRDAGFTRPGCKTAADDSR